MQRALLVALCAALFAGCSNNPTAGDCDRLVAHIIDLELAASAPASAESETEIRARIEADIGARSREMCLGDLPMSQVRCGLQARTVAELARCDEG